ncbi:hypothetical protein, partial [Halorubrum sp. SP9]
MDVEVERHPPRIESEDELYTASRLSGGWDNRWRVWFRPIGEKVVRVVDEKAGDSYDRSDYIPRAAVALIRQQDVRVVRD